MYLEAEIHIIIFSHFNLLNNSGNSDLDRCRKYVGFETLLGLGCDFLEGFVVVLSHHNLERIVGKLYGCGLASIDLVADLLLLEENLV